MKSAILWTLNRLLDVPAQQIQIEGKRSKTSRRSRKRGSQQFCWFIMVICFSCCLKLFVFNHCLFIMTGLPKKNAQNSQNDLGKLPQQRLSPVLCWSSGHGRLLDKVLQVRFRVGMSAILPLSSASTCTAHWFCSQERPCTGQKFTEIGEVVSRFRPVGQRQC